MNIKKIFSGAAAVLMLSALLTGCGASLKTARVAAKFGAALKEQPVTSATAEISCGLRTSGLGISAESKFRTVVRSRTDWESGRSYSDIESTVTVLGSDLTQNMQCYTSGETGELVRYIHLDGLDTWVRLENQRRAIDIDPSVILLLLDKVSEDTTMEVKENQSGSIYYVLGLTFTAEDIREFMETAGMNIPEEFADCDLKGVTIPIELELEDKTFLPVSLKIHLQGINQDLIRAMARAFAKGKEIEGIDVEMDEISLLITNFGYGPQDIPMLPKGAAEYALDMEKVKELQN